MPYRKVVRGVIVNPIVSGGTVLPELSNPAGARQILSGYQAIDAEGNIITGTIPSQDAQTIAPGMNNKTIAAGQYLSGTQTIAGDAALIPENIRSGANIFGVAGNVQAQQMASGTLSADSYDYTCYYCNSNATSEVNISDGDSTSISAVYGSLLLIIYTDRYMNWNESGLTQLDSFNDSWSSTNVRKIIIYRVNNTKFSFSSH